MPRCSCATVSVRWWWTIVRNDLAWKVGVSPAFRCRPLARPESRGAPKRRLPWSEPRAGKTACAGSAAGRPISELAGGAFLDAHRATTTLRGEKKVRGRLAVAVFDHRMGSRVDIVAAQR